MNTAEQLTQVLLTSYVTLVHVAKWGESMLWRLEKG